MIPDFLKPPTDNLYKFMCICGLVLFLISATYPPWLFHRSSIASLEAQRDAELLRLDIEDLQKIQKAYIDQLRLEIQVGEIQTEEAKNVLDEIKSKTYREPSRSQRVALKEKIEQQKAEGERNDKRKGELDAAVKAAETKVKVKHIELSYKSKVINWESRYGTIVMILCIVGLVFGAVLGRKGFNLWSLRVQVYQDAILKSQAPPKPQEVKRDIATTPP